MSLQQMRICIYIPNDNIYENMFRYKEDAFMIKNKPNPP